MKKYLYNILFSCICISVWGQEQSNLVENSIQVLASTKQNEVLLRWAPSTPTIWLKSNQYGYIIERYTIYRDGIRLEKPEKKVLTSSPLKPDPLEMWEKIVNENDYAAIIAQSLYGDSFVVEGVESEGGILEILNKAEEIEQRFSFALFAADMNFEAAKKAGLGFEDSSVQNNERYFYKIISAIPQEIAMVEEGNVFVDLEKIEDLPAPIDVLAIGGDKNIMLTWEYEMFKSIYTSYYVERSDDGKTFKRLSDIPLVNLNDKPDAPAKRMYYIDTLSQNDKVYHYKIIGISPFGEEGPSSQIVSAKGQKDLGFSPHISDFKFTPTGGALIQWEFPKEGEPEISEFQLNRAPDARGPYNVVKTGIAISDRSVVYENLSPTNYFTITAIGKNNQKTTSLEALVQTIDSIPPTQPLGLIGIVDSLGIVNLTWDKNIESDMLGYRVFRGNLKNEEVSQLTIDPIEENNFIDSVNIKSLNSKIFYQVVAVDQRFNMSPYSEKLELKKPDVVPPSSPIFSGYGVENGVVTLQWQNSSSDDVAAHKLYRQDVLEGENGWKLIFETNSTSTYKDDKVVSGKKYRYAIFAEDESNLTSAPSTPLTLTIKNFEAQEYIKGLLATPDRTNMLIDLSWRKPDEEVIEILIYKSKTGETPVLYRQLPSNINKLADTKVFPNNTYVYHIKPVLKQGGIAAVKTIEVKY